MKIKIVLFILSMVVLCGCTRNNGDIGDLFGRWRVESLTIDGMDVDLYDEETLLYTWSFQSSLIFISVLQPYDSYYNIKGSWSKERDILSLNFGYTGEDGEFYYTPPANLYLNKGVTDLMILKYTSRSLILEKAGENGERYVYKLKKAY